MNQSDVPPPTPPDPPEIPDPPATPVNPASSEASVPAASERPAPAFELETHTPRPRAGASSTTGMTPDTTPADSSAASQPTGFGPGSPGYRALEELPEPEPVWPEVLSNVCLVLGVIGMILALVNVVGYSLILIGVSDREGEPSIWILTIHVFFHILRFALAALLTVGGWALRAQWPSSVYWLRVWAGLKMLLVFSTTLLTWALLVVSLYHVFHGDKPQTDHGHLHPLLRFAWSFVSLSWGWLLPVFVLIWLQRRSVRELVASWSD